MPDDTLDLSAIPDFSAEVADGWAQWLGEKPRSGRTALSTVRSLQRNLMSDDVGPNDSVSASGSRIGSQTSEDLCLIMAQLKLEEAQTEA